MPSITPTEILPPNLTLGIDEAGRGPVIGPLVLCGVWLTTVAEHELAHLGIQDSKSFGSGPVAQAAREALSQRVREHADYVGVTVADAAEVDRWVYRGELNLLERELARAIIEAGPPATKIYADGKTLFRPLGARYPQLEAHNRADSDFISVAAASIVAKSERDRLFREFATPLEGRLGQKIGGGGYANRATERFLERYVDHFGELPAAVRRSWSWPQLRMYLDQAGLEDEPLLAFPENDTLANADEGKKDDDSRPC